MDRPRTTAIVLLTLALATVGCISTPVGRPTSTVTPTATPLPQGSVGVPDGPKESPEHPVTVNESAVRRYVKTFEYRIVYNSLWVNEHTDVTLACRVDNVSKRSWGYEAVVTCTGYSNTDVPQNGTATAGSHADWFTQSFQYRVSGNATHRHRVDPREPVS